MYKYPKHTLLLALVMTSYTESLKRGKNKIYNFLKHSTFSLTLMNHATKNNVKILTLVFQGYREP